jgi:hypothetical protein
VSEQLTALALLRSVRVSLRPLAMSQNGAVQPELVPAVLELQVPEQPTVQQVERQQMQVPKWRVVD